ncbi:hypothetical protein SNEBB_005625 [Seison nebaliae]|nr:hypothetical protein SNEBB_005625 [Seison nebaliae]
MYDSQNRLSEFTSIVNTFRSKNSYGENDKKKLSNKDMLIDKCKRFNQLSKGIGSELSRTYSKLEKLSIIARQHSLFNDKSQEIQQLMLIIKSDVNGLNGRLGQLQEYMKSESRNHNNLSKNIQSHNNTIVLNLQSQLATMSNEFKGLLEESTEKLKEQKNRKDQFSSNVPLKVSNSQSSNNIQKNQNEKKVATNPLLLNSSGSALYRGPTTTTTTQSNGNEGTSSSELRQRLNAPIVDPYSGAILDGGSSSTNLTATEIAMESEQHSQQQQQQQQLLVKNEGAFLTERANAMENIEKTIVDLGTIFQQLAHMVHQQEEIVLRIDENVDEINVNITGAYGELMKYFKSISSSRWLTVKIFGILLIFLILFILFR